MTPRSWRWLVLAVPAFAACAQVIGADFNGLLPDKGAGGSAGTDQTGPGGSAGDETLAGGGGAGGALGGAAGGAGNVIKDAAVDHTGAGGANPLSDAAMDVATADHKDVALVPPDAPLEGSVVINEIKGTGAGPDWIELHNPGLMPMVLDGYTVTQATGTFGPPDLAAFVTFPQGTTLAGGAFLMVVPDSSLPIGGPTIDCLGVAPTCFTGNWGVSSGGERMYLLKPEADGGWSILEQEDYPPLVSGQTYARAANGMFQAAAPTPNEPNGI